MPDEPLRVLIVGLDGGTFDLMTPWMDDGTLPNLAGLMKRGAASPLRSTAPPITPCAWSSFMTGKNPGKHGLFDFVQPTPDGRGVQFTNASFRRGETLWGLLSRQGRRVGVVNVPMTYPPEEVNGYLISGLDTPHEQSPYMFPADVRKEIAKAGVRYRIDQQHLGNMNTDRRRARQLEEIFDAESARTEALKVLSRTRPADFRMVVYGATDQVQHHFWHYMDERHDKHDAAGAEKFRHAIRDTYRHVDGLLGELLEDCGEDTVVIVMSDHGFGPTSSVRLRLNQALSDAGLLTFKPRRQAGRLRSAIAGWADRLLRTTLSSDAKRAIAGRLPRLRAWFENLDEAEIDWDKTVVHANESYRSSPALWVNPAVENVEGVLDQAEEAVRAITDPKTGRPVVSHVVRTSDIYSGLQKDRAPQLLLSWWEDGFLLEQSDPAGGASHAERCGKPIAGGVEFAGSHRMDGVFMMAGGPTRPGFRSRDAEIIDIAPTVLHLMGLPVPRDMDGRVLTECISEAWLASNPVRYEDDPSDPPADSAREHAFSESESELIARRLQALGYIQ